MLDDAVRVAEAERGAWIRTTCSRLVKILHLDQTGEMLKPTAFLREFLALHNLLPTPFCQARTVLHLELKIMFLLTLHLHQSCWRNVLETLFLL